MKVLIGSGSDMLGNAVCERLHVSPAELQLKRFPDGECYIRIADIADIADTAGGGSLEDDDVVIIQNCYPDENIIEFALIRDAARDAGAKRIIGIVPYMGYARQDRKFKPGEPVSAKTIVDIIQPGMDAVFTIDIHENIINAWFSCASYDITGMGEIGTFLGEQRMDMVIAPDKGAVELARTAANVAGIPFDYLEKDRVDEHTVRMHLKELDVSGKRVAIVDDIISTGGTIITAVEQLRSQGAIEVHAACTHGLFTGDAIDRLRKAIDGLYSTNTLENSTSVISVAGAVAKALQKYLSTDET